MKRFGLLGKNISHSKSPEIYKEILKFPFIYKLIDCKSIDDVPTLSSLANDFDGINITAPYKQVFLELVKIDSVATRVGAINCIGFKEKNAFATNTDFEAFKYVYLKNKFNEIRKIILLGDGAMANMVSIALQDYGYEYKQFSRKLNGDLNFLDYKLMADYNDHKLLVINTCSREFVFNPKLKPNSSTIFFDLNYSF